MISFIAGAIFITSYLFITLEHKVKVSKSAIALAAGGALWILTALAGTPHMQEELTHAGADIFAIVIFLLAAMSLVEILIHYRFFDLVRGWIYRWHLSERGQFIVVAVLTFFFSGVLDNLTVTIIMIQIARKFFKGENMVLVAATIVIAANAGGAFSPIGDVTTVMLWFADKFSAIEIISYAFLPSLALFGTALALTLRKIKKETPDEKSELVFSLSRSEKLVVGLVFLSFLLPIALSFVGLPPYFGLLVGLGVVWIVIDLLKNLRPKETHLEASIERFIRNTDIPSLKFFIGILLAVSALGALGVLEHLAAWAYGAAPSDARLILGNIGLGVVSAVLDNVPLTAIAIQTLQMPHPQFWALLAVTVGTGGSLLVIGTVSGVVAMGMVKELNFSKYLKVAFVPALAGYAVAVAVWGLQFLLVR